MTTLVARIVVATEPTYENGVLTLTIPVIEAAKPRKVDITHAENVVEAVTAGSAAE